MASNGSQIVGALHRLGLAGRPVCVHASLRSFTPRIPADDVVAAFLAAGCTLLVVSGSPCFAAPAPAGHRALPFNAEDDASIPGPEARTGPGYDVLGNEYDPGLGALTGAVLGTKGRQRGRNPLSSFTAIGRDAEDLVAGQSALDVFAPLRALVEADGAVLLIGTNLTSATIVHLAEEQAGRPLLQRWARGETGSVVPVRHGGCSRGFERLAPRVAGLARLDLVQGSRWRTYPAGALVAALSPLLAADPGAATCADPNCVRCANVLALPRT